MGNAGSTQQQQYYGLPVPTGIIREFCHPYEITLCLAEQVTWAGDAFQIRDVNGNPCFVMKGKAMSFSHKKTLQDLHGRPLVNFRHEFSFFKKYSIYYGDSDQRLLATIRPHTVMGIRADIDFTNIDGTPRSFALEGNFLASQATIIDRMSNAIVGRISRERRNVNDLLWGKQTYYVTVAPNALDEAKHDNKKSGIL